MLQARFTLSGSCMCTIEVGRLLFLVKISISAFGIGSCKEWGIGLWGESARGYNFISSYCGSL